MQPIITMSNREFLRNFKKAKQLLKGGKAQKIVIPDQAGDIELEITMHVIGKPSKHELLEQMLAEGPKKRVKLVRFPIKLSL